MTTDNDLMKPFVTDDRSLDSEAQDFDPDEQSLDSEGQGFDPDEQSVVSDHKRAEPPKPMPWDPLDEVGGMPTRGSWMVVFASALLGAVLGGLFTGLLTPPFTSVTLVQGAPARLNPSFLTPDDDRYAQTEAAYAGLEEGAVTALLQERTKDSTLQAAEVSLIPGTTILRFTATGETAQAAADAANISAEAYVEAWRQRTSAALTESLALLDQALAVPSEGNAALVAERTELVTQLAAVQSQQRVVKSASTEGKQGVAAYAPGAIIGGLVGAAAGLSWVLWRRHSKAGGAG